MGLSKDFILLAVNLPKNYTKIFFGRNLLKDCLATLTIFTQGLSTIDLLDKFTNSLPRNYVESFTIFTQLHKDHI